MTECPDSSAGARTVSESGLQRRVEYESSKQSAGKALIREEAARKQTVNAAFDGSNRYIDASFKQLIFFNPLYELLFGCRSCAHTAGGRCCAVC